MFLQVSVTHITVFIDHNNKSPIFCCHRFKALHFISIFLEYILYCVRFGIQLLCSKRKKKKNTDTGTSIVYGPLTAHATPHWHARKQIVNKLNIWNRIKTAYPTPWVSPFIPDVWHDSWRDRDLGTAEAKGDSIKNNYIQSNKFPIHSCIVWL